MFTQKLVQTDRGQFEVFVRGEGSHWRLHIHTTDFKDAFIRITTFYEGLLPSKFLHK